MTFVGAPYRNMGGQLLKRDGRTQKQLHCQGILQHHKAGDPEHTAQLADSSASWRLSFPGPPLVWTSSRQLSCFLLLLERWSNLGVILTCLSGRDSQFSLLTLAGRSLETLVSFRDFLSGFELFSFLFKELPCWMECFYHGGNSNNRPTWDNVPRLKYKKITSSTQSIRK